MELQTDAVDLPRTRRKITQPLGGTVSLIIAGSQDSRQFVLRLVVPFGALLLALVYSQKQASVTVKAAAAG